MLNLNAGRVASSPLFSFHLAMFEAEKCLRVSFLSLLSLSLSSCPSLLSMPFLESTVFVKRVFSLFSNANHFSVFLVIGLLFAFSPTFLILLSTVTSNNCSEKSGRCTVF